MGRLLLALAVVATCLAQPSAACGGCVDGISPKRTEYLKKGIGHGLDYTKFEMNPAEKQLIAKIRRNHSKEKKSVIAGMVLLFGGALLAQAGGVLLALPNPDTKSLGGALFIPGLLSVGSSLAPFVMASIAEEKAKADKKMLSDLARKRAENNRRHDIIANLLRRPVISKDGELVGARPQVDESNSALQILQEGLA